MKLYRYMSQKEFNKYLNGKKLVNNFDYTTSNRSGSKGFCFLGEYTTFSVNSNREELKFTFSPSKCYDFLTGIVSCDLLIEFESIR